jgi:hypothetical protein
LALLGVLASPRPVAAGFGGNDFLKFCERNKAGSNACTFYIVGWRDAFYAATIFRYGTKKIEQNPKMGICIPDGVQREQMKKVLLKYLRDHPEKLHETTGLLVLKAMHEAFPCR